MSGFADATFLKSAHESRQFVADEGLEVAFAGRSNAGKSSAINAITNRRHLARTSKSPGRTQLVNFFLLEHGRRLVDLPGYGYARVPQTIREHWRGLMDAYFETRNSLRGLVLVVDARRGLGDLDRQMVCWSSRQQRHTLILLTKADKLKRGAATNVLYATEREMAGKADVMLFSAVRTDGVEAARGWLQAMFESTPG
ncbi:ribosome biogenesis GTP-binding protein YihA/YsxC [soil metagenome]